MNACVSELCVHAAAVTALAAVAFVPFVLVKGRLPPLWAHFAWLALAHVLGAVTTRSFTAAAYAVNMTHAVWFWSYEWHPGPPEACLLYKAVSMGPVWACWYLLTYGGKLPAYPLVLYAVPLFDAAVLLTSV